MTRPVVIYSAMGAEDASGFSRYVLRTYKPKGAHACALVERIRRDPTFPRHINQRDTFLLLLRYRPHWPWTERRLGGEIWSRYASWQRGQDKLAA